jgi:putative holliday junction resolvase|tara:strand:- start:5719 stop:6201 length:483 start_codon:yes stop_codon:yes gene_type:complete
MIYDNITDLKRDLQPESRFLALDVGTKVIGMAICDPSRTICNPFGTISRLGNKKDFLKIQEYIKQNEIELLVIGLPIHINGSESKISIFVRRFATNIDVFLLGKIKILLHDERYSSSSARIFIDDNLKLTKKHNRKKTIDKIAANIILETFILDFNKSVI